MTRGQMAALLNWADWPSTDKLNKLAGDTAVLERTAEVLSVVRTAKSDAKTSMRTEVASLRITDSEDRMEPVKLAESALARAASALSILFVPGEDTNIDVELAAS